MKFIFKTTRANMPMSMSGTMVTHAPESSHCKPVAKSFAPVPRPTGGEEKRDAEFAEGEVGIHQHVPDLAPDATNPARG